MLTDTHAHLDFPEFSDELEAVVKRAADAGVNRIITIGTSLEGSRRALEIARRFENVYCAIGIHPNSASKAAPDAIEGLCELARDPKVAAMGEIGLDYHWLPGAKLRGEGASAESVAEADRMDAEEKAVQARLFRAQLDLAVELGFNVVIHQRDSWDDTFELLKDYTRKLRAVYHCFGESPKRARQLFELGHLVSFTGIVTFKNAQVVHETAAQVPGDRYMVETDCPFLAPVPHRGKRSEPAHTRITAERVAVLRDTPLQRVAAETEANAEAFFRLGSR